MQCSCYCCGGQSDTSPQTFWLQAGRPRAPNRGSSGIWYGVRQLFVTRVYFHRPTGGKASKYYHFAVCVYMLAHKGFHHCACCYLSGYARQRLSFRPETILLEVVPLWVTPLPNCVFNALSIQLPILLLSPLSPPEIFGLHRGHTVIPARRAIRSRGNHSAATHAPLLVELEPVLHVLLLLLFLHFGLEPLHVLEKVVLAEVNRVLAFTVETLLKHERNTKKTANVQRRSAGVRGGSIRAKRALENNRLLSAVRWPESMRCIQSRSAPFLQRNQQRTT